MDEPTQTERYPMAGANPSNGLAVPTRETEINRELNDNRHLSVQLMKLAEELTQRLSSVISPKDDGQTIKDSPEATVSTQLATNIREINNDLKNTKRTLNFILSGLEL